MATLAELHDQVAAAVEALAIAPERMDSDYRTDLERIPAGAHRYQLQVVALGEDPTSGSNAVRQEAGVTLFLHHALADPRAERAYTQGPLHTALEDLTRAAWWRAFAAVYGIAEIPTLQVTRVGNVVSSEVGLQVGLVP